MVQRVNARSLRFLRLLILLFCGLSSLTACKKEPRAQAADLTAQVLFTANGTYDAQTDLKEKLGASWRRGTWISQPPLAAQRVVAEYDGNARAQSWMLEVTAPQFSALELAGQGAREVQTVQGQGLRPAAASRLNQTLILPTHEGLRILSRGYVIQKEPDLLPAFKP